LNNEKPRMSEHFLNMKPSSIRKGQIKFDERTDDAKALNLAIGNVSLPMHPAMQERMNNLNSENSPFKDGVVKYSSTAGFDETRQAFLNILKSSGFNIEGLGAQVTSGGSQAMLLTLLGVCGPAGTSEDPLLLIDAAYTNYVSIAKAIGRKTVSVRRHLDSEGKFSLPNEEEIESTIKEHKPNALVVIPYDNPTGHFYTHESLVGLAKLCVKYNLWIISDEAYRELHYTEHDISSVWAITEEEVPGISGQRISIETASKVWNACGLRIGGIVTDNKEFLTQHIAAATPFLCTNVIGQYIFGALAHESAEDLQKWYGQVRNYYKGIMTKATAEIKTALPGAIVSSPDAAIYSVIDVREIAKPGFDMDKFLDFCAETFKTDIDGEEMTPIVAPMAGFYNVAPGEVNPGITQARIAYVDKPEVLDKFAGLFAKAFNAFEEQR